jgi:hypothetical protein
LTHPRRIGKAPLCAPVSDLAASDENVFVSFWNRGFAQIDASDPSRPAVQEDPDRPWQVLKATEDRLYVWHRSKYNLRILDRSRGGLPVIGRYAAPQRYVSSVSAAINGNLAHPRNHELWRLAVAKFDRRQALRMLPIDLVGGPPDTEGEHAET